MGRDDAPILEFDPATTAMVEPRRVVGDERHSPRRVVLCFFRQVIERLRDEGAPELFQLEAAHGIHPVYGVDIDGEQIGVFHPGVGAPLAGAFFEEAIAHGAERCIAVGTAGGLVADRAIGHVVVPVGAIRDEGTSYHYLPPGRRADPSPEAVAAVEAVLRRHGVGYETGLSWSTDGFYRETEAKVARRVAEGCRVVDMEASALFAIAAFRGVTLGMLLTTSDDLSGDAWSGFPDEPDHDGRYLLFRMAAEAVLEL